jgi:hypothetical protein
MSVNYIACARPKCDGQFDAHAVYLSSYQKEGFCSDRCRRLVNNGASRKIENNGGIVPGSENEQLLRSHNFSLADQGMHRKKWTNGTASIESAHKQWEIVGHVKVSATQVARRVIERVDKGDGAIAKAIAIAQRQRPANELQEEIDTITRPREVELKMLNDLRNELLNRIESHKRMLIYEQENLSSGKSAFPALAHADIIATNGAIVALKRELDDVDQRIKNHIPPAMSPVAPHRVIEDEQLVGAGNHSWHGKWRDALLHGTGGNTDHEWNS